MEERLAAIEKELQVYNELLKEHIKRTDILESFVRDNDDNWKSTVDRLEIFQEKQQRFTLKILAGIGTFTGVLIPLIVKLLGAI